MQKVSKNDLCADSMFYVQRPIVAMLVAAAKATVDPRLQMKIRIVRLEGLQTSPRYGQ